MNIKSKDELIAALLEANPTLVRGGDMISPEAYTFDGRAYDDYRTGASITSAVTRAIKMPFSISDLKSPEFNGKYLHFYRYGTVPVMSADGCSIEVWLKLRFGLSS